MRSFRGTPIVVLATALVGWATIAIVGNAPGVTGAASAGEAAGPTTVAAGSARAPIDPDALGFDSNGNGVPDTVGYDKTGDGAPNI